MNENVSSEGNKLLGLSNLSIADSPNKNHNKNIDNDDEDDDASVKFAMLSPKLEQLYLTYSNTHTKPSLTNPSQRSIQSSQRRATMPSISESTEKLGP